MRVRPVGRFGRVPGARLAVAGALHTYTSAPGGLVGRVSCNFLPYVLTYVYLKEDARSGGPLQLSARQIILRHASVTTIVE